MSIEYYKKYEPFFGSWYIKETIGEGSFGEVFLIERKEHGRVFSAALKAITIPKNRSEIKRFIAEGFSKNETSTYFESVVNELIVEYELMSELKGNSNIVSYEDHQVIRHEDEIGFDIFIKMEFLTPLIDTIPKMSLEDVVNLGIDICKALELCEKKRIIHRDIKPENMFINDNGDYKLGDFGVAKVLDRTNGGLSKKGTYTYMAPEVYKGEPYGASVDTYSLGIVLYRMLNNNRAPFEPREAKKISYSSKEEALRRRLSGETIPALENIDGLLSIIIQKACAYKSSDRFQSPKEMRNALEMYKLVISKNKQFVDNFQFSGEKETKDSLLAHNYDVVVHDDEIIHQDEEKTEVLLQESSAEDTVILEESILNIDLPNSTENDDNDCSEIECESDGDIECGGDEAEDIVAEVPHDIIDAENADDLDSQDISESNYDDTPNANDNVLSEEDSINSDDNIDDDTYDSMWSEDGEESLIEYQTKNEIEIKDNRDSISLVESSRITNSSESQQTREIKGLIRKFGIDILVIAGLCLVLMIAITIGRDRLSNNRQNEFNDKDYYTDDTYDLWVLDSNDDEAILQSLYYVESDGYFVDEDGSDTSIMCPKNSQGYVSDFDNGYAYIDTYSNEGWLGADLLQPIESPNLYDCEEVNEFGCITDSRSSGIAVHPEPRKKSITYYKLHKDEVFKVLYTCYADDTQFAFIKYVDSNDVASYGWLNMEYAEIY